MRAIYSAPMSGDDSAIRWERPHDPEQNISLENA